VYSTTGPKLGLRKKLGRGSQGSWQRMLGRKGGEPKEKGDKDDSCNAHAVRCFLKKSRPANESGATYNSDTGPPIADEMRCDVRRETRGRLRRLSVQRVNEAKLGVRRCPCHLSRPICWSVIGLSKLVHGMSGTVQRS
jgi:hypothetical protein